MPPFDPSHPFSPGQITQTILTALGTTTIPKDKTVVGLARVNERGEIEAKIASRIGSSDVFRIEGDFELHQDHKVSGGVQAIFSF